MSETDRVQNAPVHWREGLFLHPHHFQAGERHRSEQLGRGLTWTSPFSWGLRQIEWSWADRAATDHTLVVGSLKLRLKDGTLVSIPEDGSLDPLTLKPYLEHEQAVTVLLGVPHYRIGGSNVSRQPEDRTRYLQQTRSVRDENNGDNPQIVEVRQLNVRLFAGAEDPPGYDVLRIARFVKPIAGSSPTLDPTFIPAILTCATWPELTQRFTKLRQDIEEWFRQLSRDWNPEKLATDHRLFALYQALQEGYATVGLIERSPGVTPFAAYAELCQLVGRWTIFDRTALRLPELKPYDHDNLGQCFSDVFAELYRLLTGDVRTTPPVPTLPGYRPRQGGGLFGGDLPGVK